MYIFVNIVIHKLTKIMSTLHMIRLNRTWHVVMLGVSVWVSYQN